MKKDLLKALFITIAGFLLFFLIRLGYGYIKYPPGSTIQNLPSASSQRSISFGGNNYASKKIRQKGSRSRTLEQKYEKIADIASFSADFDKDEKRVRDLIGQHEALIQFEQKSGLNKNRRLFLAIGVHPDKFDALIEDLKKIGKIISLSISKKDKTNEYKSLQAKKTALTTSIKSLRRLKGRGGPVRDLIELEAKILEAEQKIQNLGVSLGEFDEENEFVTIKYDLQAGGLIVRSLGILYRTKVAFQWSAKYYSLTLIIIFCGTMSLLVFSLVLEKLNWVPKVISAMYTSVKNFYSAKVGLVEDEPKEKDKAQE